MQLGTLELSSYKMWPLLLLQRVSLKRTSEAALSSAEDYIIGACNHFFLLNARNCVYARMQDLRCAVVCCKELWFNAQMGRFRMHNDNIIGYVPMDDLIRMVTVFAFCFYSSDPC